ncbi:hypothetical protein ACKLNR_014163 [Fusarium oxysporum f. sp. zingiberi]
MDALSRLNARLRKGKPGSPKTSHRNSTGSSAASSGSTQVVQLADQPTVRGAQPGPWAKILTSPRQGVHVTVYHHPLHRAGTEVAANDPNKGLYLWTFITTNLKSVAAGELAMAVKCRPNEDPDSYPTDFLQVCDNVYQRAKNEHPILRRWKLLELDEALFGRPDWKTVVLGLRNSPIPGLDSVKIEDSPIPHFYCLPLSEDELITSRLHGTVRVLCGTATEWFPFVPYVDRDRGSNINLDVMKTSVLAVGNSTFHRLEVTGLNILWAEPRGPVTLHIPADRAQWFKFAIMDKREASVNSLLILSDLHDSCGSFLVWQPRLPAKIRTMANPLKNIAANFLILSFNQATDALQATEDGILVLLNPDSTARFFDAATKGQKLSIQLGSTETFELSWSPSWDTLSISKMSNLAEMVFQPDGDPNDRPADPEHIKVDSIRLLHEPRLANSSIQAFGEFQKMAEQAIMAAIPPRRPGLLPQGCGIIARFRVPKINERSFSIMLLVPPQTERMIMRAMDPLAGNEVQDLTNELGAVMDGLQVPDGLVYGDWMEWEILFWCWGCDPNNMH